MICFYGRHSRQDSQYVAGVVRNENPVKDRSWVKVGSHTKTVTSEVVSRGEGKSNVFVSLAVFEG